MLMLILQQRSTKTTYMWIRICLQGVLEKNGNEQISRKHYFIYVHVTLQPHPLKIVATNSKSIDCIIIFKEITPNENVVSDSFFLSSIQLWLFSIQYPNIMELLRHNEAASPKLYIYINFEQKQVNSTHYLQIHAESCLQQRLCLLS